MNRNQFLANLLDKKQSVNLILVVNEVESNQNLVELEQNPNYNVLNIQVRKGFFNKLPNDNMLREVYLSEKFLKQASLESLDNLILETLRQTPKDITKVSLDQNKQGTINDIYNALCHGKERIILQGITIELDKTQTCGTITQQKTAAYQNASYLFDKYFN